MLYLPEEKQQQIIAEWEDFSAELGENHWPAISSSPDSSSSTSPLQEPTESQEQGLQKDSIIRDSSEIGSGGSGRAQIMGPGTGQVE